MSRLIDIDALTKKCCIQRDEFETCEECIEYYAKYTKDGIGICYLEYRGEDVRNAPTIDAIPVEWLRQKMQKPLMTSANPFDYVLCEWQDEQEARNESD